MKNVILKEDLVLIMPKGTIFEDCAGETRKYYTGNFSTKISLNKDNTTEIVINDNIISDNPNKFKKIK